MKLAEAKALENSDQHLPPADQRLGMLEQQLGNFRNEWYGHVQLLERCEAWKASGVTHVPGRPDPVTGQVPSQSIGDIQAKSEKDLDTLHVAIERMLEEIETVKKQIRAVNPDAV